VASQAWPAAHAAHVPPAVPQAASVTGTHRPALLQQPSHAARSHAHAPALHACEGAHAAQAAPPRPQAATVGGLTH
jgi:hypothetical protein